MQPDGPPLTLFPDLLGFRPVPADRVVDWRTLLDVPGEAPAQRARPVDRRLAAALIHLPVDLTGRLEDQVRQSLAARDLVRGVATALPSGEAVARRVGEEPLTREETAPDASGWPIVGEVLVGIVHPDPRSYRSVDPAWRPTLPARMPGGFMLADLLVPA